MMHLYIEDSAELQAYVQQGPHAPLPIQHTTK